MIIAAIVEIIAVCLLANAYVKNPFKGIPIVLWPCSLFAVYRIGFQIAPERAGVCKCFGVGSILGKMESKSDGLGLALLLLMFFGGAGLLLWSRPRKNSATVNRMAKVTLFVVSSLFLTLEYSNAEGTFNPLYSVEGIIKQTILDNSGKVLSTNAFQFKISLDSKGQWQMAWKVYFPQWSLTSTEYISYNGTDIFSVTYADKRLDREMKPVSNLPLEDHEHPGRVCRGPFPVDHGSCIGLLWIAFIGGDYVVQNPKVSPPNFFVDSARVDPEAWAVEFQYKLVQNSPNPLIASGSFSINKAASSHLIDYPEVDEPGNAEGIEATHQMIRRIKNAKTDELLRSTYTLQESKLVENINIPTKFSATRYSPIGSAFGHFPFIEWDGEVTNIVTNAASLDVLPLVIGKINVQDRRFKQRTETHFLNDVYYLLDKTGWVMSTNDWRFQGTNSLPLLERQSTDVRKAGYVFSIILFALLISLPVCLFARKVWKWRQATRT